MSSNELRNSIRGALAHRVTRSDSSKPYLDKIICLNNTNSSVSDNTQTKQECLEIS